MTEVNEVKVRLDTKEIEELLYEEDKQVVWVHVENADKEVRITIEKEGAWG